MTYVLLRAIPIRPGTRLEHLGQGDCLENPGIYPGQKRITNLHIPDTRVSRLPKAAAARLLGLHSA